MAKARLFLDANSLADLYIVRPRYPRLIEMLTGLDGQICVSVLSVGVCAYITRKEPAFTLNALESLVSTMEVLSVKSTTLTEAFNTIQDSDLEDALQVACALESKIDLFYPWKSKRKTASRGAGY